MNSEIYFYQVTHEKSTLHHLSVRLLIKILMSLGRKEGINTGITNVVLELFYICVHWYMPNITYVNLFTCRLLQGLLGCIIRRRYVWRAFACPAPRPALREAVLWRRAKCWWYLLSLSLSGYERTEEPTEPWICPFCIPWSKSVPVHAPHRTGSVGKGRKKFSKVFLSFVICQE